MTILTTITTIIIIIITISINTIISPAPPCVAARPFWSRSRATASPSAIRLLSSATPWLLGRLRIWLSKRLSIVWCNWFARSCQLWVLAHSTFPTARSSHSVFYPTSSSYINAILRLSHYLTTWLHRHVCTILIYDLNTIVSHSCHMLIPWLVWCVCLWNACTCRRRPNPFRYEERLSEDWSFEVGSKSARSSIGGMSSLCSASRRSLIAVSPVNILSICLSVCLSIYLYDIHYYMHICIYVYIYIYTMCVHIYIYIYIRTMCVYIYIYIYVYMYVYIYIYTHNKVIYT